MPEPNPDHTVTLDQPSSEQPPTLTTNLPPNEAPVEGDETRAFAPARREHDTVPIGTVVGDYQLLAEIARGGMGVVYMARQIKLNRVVALKVNRAGQLASADEAQRFQVEAEAAAKLDHPHIVPIHEVGEVDGRQYISMAYIDGQSLAQRVVAGPLPPREAAGVMRHVADAVAYAHAQGVIHRDLKPGNILMDATGQPRVTDFGLAKRADADSSLTQAGQIMGTPNFMPPEQAEGKNDEVGPPADVYSLGATLYCLLTGRPPFQAATVLDTLKQVVEREPVAPHHLNPAVDRDLDTICLKCLQKRPDRRYTSATALAEDLQRYLNGRPIQARPVGAIEKAVRWGRRNPALALALASVVAVVLAAFVLVTGSYYRTEQARQDEAFQREEAERKEKSERWERYRSNLIAAGSAMRLHNVAAARDALDAAPEEHRGWEWRHFYHQLDVAAHVHPGFGVTGLAFDSPSRQSFAMYSGSDRSLYFFDPVARRLLLHAPNTRNRDFGRFSRDGKLVAFNREDFGVDVWNVADQRVQITLKGHTGLVAWFDFSPDGTHVVTGSLDRTCRVWDLSTGKELLALPPYPEAVARVCFSRDGKRIFTTSGRDNHLWDATTGKRLADYPRLTDAHGLMLPCFADDLAAVVEEYPSNRVRMFDLTTGKQAAELLGHTNQIMYATFSPDGRLFATCALDQTIRVWESRTSKLLFTLTGHTGWVNWLDFSPDGTRLVSASQDHTARLWDVKTGTALAVLHGHTAAIEFVAYTPDGGSVVVVARDGSIRWFDTRLAEQNGVIRGHTNFVYGVAFHPDGERVASAAWDGTVRVWHATTGRELAVFKHADKAIVTTVAFHPDGRHLVSQGRDDDVHLWDLETNQLIHRFPLPTQLWRDSRLTFSRDGKRLAAGAKDNTVHVWDFASRKEVAVLKGHTEIVRDLVFAADGSWLATGSEIGDNTVRIWDVASGKELRKLTAHPNVIYALSLSPDGKVLATGSHDGGVRLWDTTTWAEVAVLTQGTNVYGLSFTPDGQRLAVACANNVIRLWDVGTHKAVGEFHGHTAYVHQVAFSPDGSRLVSGSGDMTLRVWDTLSAAERAQKAVPPSR